MLEFSNGERYVGQSRDVVRRLADHRRRFHDVVAVRFCPVPPNDLDSAERQMIQREVDSGSHLRNVDLVSQTWADCVLDQVVDRDVQADWTHGGPQTHVDDTRMLIAKRRHRTAGLYRRMQELHDFGSIFHDLCVYADRIIPWPSATDGRFWTVSAMPGTGRTRTLRRLTAVSCGKVETFVVLEDREEAQAWWFLNVQHDIVHSRDIPRDLRSAFTTRTYRSTGPVDVINGGVPGTLAAWLERVPGLESAARSLALQLMRKGPSLFARFHCDDLVDDILLQLDEEHRERANAPVSEQDRP